MAGKASESTPAPPRMAKRGPGSTPLARSSARSSGFSTSRYEVGLRSVEAIRRSAAGAIELQQAARAEAQQARAPSCARPHGTDGTSLRASPPSTTGFIATRCTTSASSASRMRASAHADWASRTGWLDERRKSKSMTRAPSASISPRRPDERVTTTTACATSRSTAIRGWKWDRTNQSSVTHRTTLRQSSENGSAPSLESSSVAGCQFSRDMRPQLCSRPRRAT